MFRQRGGYDGGGEKVRDILVIAMIGLSIIVGILIGYLIWHIL